MVRPRYHKAIGLRYEKGQAGAPSVGIVGDELGADEVVRVALRYGIPIREDAALVKALSSLELDEAIPEQLFEAVAVLLTELDKVRK